MLAGNALLSQTDFPTSLPRSRLPRNIFVPVKPSSLRLTYPTHALAMSSSKSSNNDTAYVFPVHDLVLAANFTQLPPLPASQQHTGAWTLTLPVLPISVPSPAAFSVLYTYLYTHRPELVLKSFFPLPSNFLQSLTPEAVRTALASRDTLHQLSSHLYSSSSSNVQTLMTHASLVKDFWENVVALGIHDPVLWDTIDLAWETILCALNLLSNRGNTAPSNAGMSMDVAYNSQERHPAPRVLPGTQREVLEEVDMRDDAGSESATVGPSARHCQDQSAQRQNKIPPTTIDIQSSSMLPHGPASAGKQAIAQTVSRCLMADCALLHVSSMEPLLVEALTCFRYEGRYIIQVGFNELMLEKRSEGVV